MIYTGILKNCHKFGIEKLNRAINLKEKSFSKRENFKKFSGVSLKKYGHVWFNLEKGEALFKTYDGDYKKEVRDLRIINELICSCLAKQVDINSAIYEPAILNNEYGVVTYNFLKANQKLLTLDNFLQPGDTTPSLVNIADKIEIFQMMGYEISKSEIIFDLYKIMIFDALTLQSDRNAFNINFIFDSNYNTITVAPMFDNEFAFSVENMCNLYFNSDNLSFKDLICNHSIDSKNLEVTSEFTFNEKRFGKQIIQLTNLAKSNEDMKEFLIKSIKKLNVNNAIEKVENMGIEITNEYKQYMKTIINGTKRN